MRVRVLFFGRLREIVGRGTDDAELAAGARVEDLFSRYSSRFPILADLRPSIAPSVNREFAAWQAPLSPGDEVAFLPPVSGGAGGVAQANEDVCALIRKPLARDEWLGSFVAPSDGALAVFEGVARNHARGRRVLLLEYEAYEAMAAAKMRALAVELHRGFRLTRVALVHRLGRIQIGETSILIALSSPHRRAALDACRFAIDAFKHSVPIWKKEFFEQGESAWAEGERPEIPGGLFR